MPYNTSGPGEISGNGISEYCSATPVDHNWPVCALPRYPKHKKHESADYWWMEGDKTPTLNAGK